MIVGWLRLMAFALVGLTIIYFFVGLYSRSVRREKLEKRWISEELEGDRDAWIEQGMRDYDRGLKKRLLWLIYILPLTAFTVAFYIVNFQ